MAKDRLFRKLGTVLAGNWESTLLQRTPKCFAGSQRLSTNTRISRLATCFLPSCYQNHLQANSFPNSTPRVHLLRGAIFSLPPNTLHKNSYLQSLGKRVRLAATGRAQNATAVLRFLAGPSGGLQRDGAWLDWLSSDRTHLCYRHSWSADDKTRPLPAISKRKTNYLP